MGQRSQGLADRFEQANREIIATVERCSDAQWKSKTSGESWSVGVVAHHVAQSHEGIAGLVQKIATAQSMPGLTMDMIDQGNAEHAKKFANVTKDETLALLRKNGTAAASAVRGLSDEQLDRSAPLIGGQPMTAQQAIERILIGHVEGHHDSIKKAMGTK
jgi:uncharacterized damage-inducible protein DinB